MSATGSRGWRGGVAGVSWLFVSCRELREQEEFVDVTLACEGQQVSAHKVVLSACSPYFRSLLKVSVRWTPSLQNYNTVPYNTERTPALLCTLVTSV